MSERRVVVRPAVSERDWNAIRSLCCRTGNNGNPIERARWPFFSELWVGPYQKLLPEWTYVAEAAAKGSDPAAPEILGYLTGCPDTAAFRGARFTRFTLPLLWRVARGRYPWNGDTRRFVKRALRFEKGPEEIFPRELLRRVDREYPAHLHVNVEASARGSGVGRELAHRFFKDLSEKRAAFGVRSAFGVCGAHVYCGPDPLPFYRRLGFEELGAREFRSGVVVYLFGVRTPALDPAGPDTPGASASNRDPRPRSP